MKLLYQAMRNKTSLTYKHLRAAILDVMVDEGDLISKGNDMYEDMGGHISHESNLDGHIEQFWKSKTQDEWISILEEAGEL